MADIGRPLKFKSVEELEKKIQDYFDKRAEERKPLTVSSLAVFLDTSRETLIDYQEKDGFSDTIKKAKAAIESYAEDQLFGGKNVAGVIFSLTNNYKWKNTQRNELTGANGGPIESNQIVFTNFKKEEL
jgi:hypothetical protein